MANDPVMTGSWSGYAHVMIEHKLQFKGKSNLTTKYMWLTQKSCQESLILPEKVQSLHLFCRQFC